MGSALEARGARGAAGGGGGGGARGGFAGPIAVARGGADGASTREVYVADAHTRRIVHLRHESGGLTWVAETRHEADLLTSLDTDEWGNLYAAAPNQGLGEKLGADLSPVAELHGLTRPKSFHVPFFTVRDHRDGRVWRAGRPQGLTTLHSRLGPLGRSAPVLRSGGACGSLAGAPLPSIHENEASPRNYLFVPVDGGG